MAHDVSIGSGVEWLILLILEDEVWLASAEA
jgi:hypothetical protein